MLDPGTVLIATNAVESGTTPVVARFIARYRVVVVRSSERMWEELDQRSDWVALLIDEDVSDSDASGLVRRAHRIKPHAAVAIATAEPGRRAPAGAFRLPAPLRPRQLSCFLYRALALELLGLKPQVVDALVSFSLRHALTIREAEILYATTAGIDRHEYLEATGIAGNTLKRQVQSLLRKCGLPGLERAAIAVLREGIEEAPGSELLQRTTGEPASPHAH